jgi:outer membrane protein OmpA-like peptidoglycan-associated protein
MKTLRQATTLVLTICLATTSAYPAASSLYNPAWTQELAWTDNNLFHRPGGSTAWLEDAYAPWWQGRVAHPITDYDASKLGVGRFRVDAAFDFELTTHRTQPGWAYRNSPSAINNVYTFTLGSKNRADRITRAGQNAYLNLGFRPIKALSADIGIEAVGNYDQRFWFPVNDEHRLHKDDKHARIVRGEVKYDTENFMIRGFEGTPNGNWVAKNDLFQLLPSQLDVERYRRMAGTVAPRGGEMRAKTPLGAFQVIGGSEVRFRYGPSVYAKYDLPTFGTWENSFVYRRENIPFSLGDPDETRWTTSYNSSYAPTERLITHAGLLYQPFRAGREYVDVTDNAGNSGVLGSEFEIRRRRALKRDGVGLTGRVEALPTRVIDQAGLGYTYLGPLAGNKQQVDADVSRLATSWMNLSLAYLYRQPVRGAVPLLYEGTTSNPGALLSSPRGPDDPFWVHWDNREAHIGSLTFIFDPTAGTPMFQFQRNVLEEWNLGTEEDSEWTGAVQYRVAHYPTNTDRLYYWEEDGTLRFDPIFDTGALASKNPLQSATGLGRWKKDQWQVVVDLSGGEAFAGSAIAYTPATNFYKPTTLYMNSGISARRGPLKSFFRYAQDVWGPEDYHNSFGWSYARIYQAGLSLDFLRDFQGGFRYVGTRMDNEFIGADTGAFDEYRLYLTYHFGIERDLGQRVTQLGRPIPLRLPEAGLALSETRFTPDGSGAISKVTLYPTASADAGLLTWRVSIRDSQGLSVREWKGSGVPPQAVVWDGRNDEGELAPAGEYRVALDVADLNGNEITSPSQIITVETKPVERPTSDATEKAYNLTTTNEGLRLTLSSFVLFAVNRSDLKETAKGALDQVLELLKAYPDNELRITGHTDSTGRDTYNQTLSERRAQSVADYLASRGVQRSRIQTVGYGKRRPVADNGTEEGRQQNRRVEIDILKK